MKGPRGHPGVHAVITALERTYEIKRVDTDFFTEE